MANSSETTRVQFTLPTALVEAIDAYCEKSHMSRSAYVEYTLASTLKSAHDVTAGVANVLATMAADDRTGK